MEQQFNQIQAVTGRKPRLLYADLIQAEAPIAKKRFFDNRALGLQKQQMKMQEDAMEAQQRQANVSNAISGISLAKEGYPYAKKAYPYLKSGMSKGLEFGKSGYNWLTGPKPTPTPAPATPTPPVTSTSGESIILADTPSVTPVASSSGGGGLTAAEASTLEGSMAGGELTAGMGTSEAAGGTTAGGAWYTGPAIAAVTMAQQMATGDTDTVVEGRRTGNVFSQNESGNWRPRFATEPWMGWANDKLGYDASPGEKWDAAINNKDWSKVVNRTPSMLHQWSNPVGAMGYTALHKGIQSGLGLKEDEAHGVMSILDPVGGIAKIAEDTYLCSQVRRINGLDAWESNALAKFRSYALENHSEITEHYLMYGPDLVMAIAAKEDPKEFYTNLYKTMVRPVINLTGDGLLEDAYRLYERITLDLFEKYVPQLYPQAQEA